MDDCIQNMENKLNMNIMDREGGGAQISYSAIGKIINEGNNKSQLKMTCNSF